MKIFAFECADAVLRRHGPLEVTGDLVDRGQDFVDVALQTGRNEQVQIVVANVAENEVRCGVEGIGKRAVDFSIQPSDNTCFPAHCPLFR